MKFNFRKALCAALMVALPVSLAGCGGSDAPAAGGKKIVHVGGTVARVLAEAGIPMRLLANTPSRAPERTGTAWSEQVSRDLSGICSVKVS